MLFDEAYVFIETAAANSLPFLYMLKFRKINHIICEKQKFKTSHMYVIFYKINTKLSLKHKI